MAYTTLISADKLAENIQNPDWAIVDCRFSLANFELGREAYKQGHIPGAIYAHLNEDLSSPHIPGKTGRHPLPQVDEIAEKLSTWGIDEQVQVVAYDDYPINGASAARLWWLLRWLGHEAVAVLNGGWRNWQEKGLPIQSEQVQRARREFSPHPNGAMVVDVSVVDRISSDPNFRVFDSRSAERYRGEIEPIDPVAGHIPGAISAPFMDNYDKDGFFLSSQDLHQRFGKLFVGVPIEKVVFYCGSGVTGAQNILASVHAGYEGARLYPGSWSEWITDPKRPIG